MAQRRIRTIHVENKNALLELLLEDTPFEKIYVASNAFRDPKTKKILEVAGKKGIPIDRITRKRMNSVSRTPGCESIIGVKPAPKKVTLAELLNTSRKSTKPLFLLILNEIHYSQNIGAILRTAFASGVTGVVISKRKSSYLTEEVTRISMGASERIPVVPMNVFDAIKQLQDADVAVVGVDTTGPFHYESDLSGDIALVLGSEDRGISQRILDRCDETISIPMEEGLQSLNVSAAGAIVMYEKKRQDDTK